jgi:hypothetical protein
MNRTLNQPTPQPVFTFVDDFFGSGTLPETMASQEIVHDTINGVLGPEGVSVKKNVLAQKAEILGILVDYTTGTVRPTDRRVIEKMFYLIFSIDIWAPQPLRYWQCLASIIHKPLRTSHGRHDPVRDTNYTHDTQGPWQPEDKGNTQRTVCNRSMASNSCSSTA